MISSQIRIYIFISNLIAILYGTVLACDAYAIITGSWTILDDQFEVK